MTRKIKNHLIWIVRCYRVKQSAVSNNQTISKQSAVSDHLLEYNCSIDFDHFDILASDANKFRLLIKESLLLERDQPQLNKTIKSFPLKRFD